MKKLLIGGITLIIVYFVFYLYNNFFTEKMLLGTYVNKNYEQKHLTELSKIRDTIQLFENRKYTSGYFGKGTYRISYSIKGTSIVLKYNYEMGKAQRGAYIKRINFGNPQIIMSNDMNYFYEKIN